MYWTIGYAIYSFVVVYFLKNGCDGGVFVDNQLSKRFFRFAMDECKGSSELYGHLSLKIAEDKQILDLSSFAADGQPIPNLLFGAVHYLLLDGKEHMLRDYYPNLIENPKNLETAFDAFKDFCRVYNKEILEILQTKLVQTNEVRRCEYLYPAFCFMYEEVQKPLALIEIGTSAGLQLLWDKYSYTYGSEEIYGNHNSTVHITSEIKTEPSPLLLNTIPPVSTRIGLDLHVNELHDSEDFLWLNALIWPEHKQRRELFARAADYVKSSQLNLIEG